MADWNPNLYLKFEKERTQPAKDLISRIEKDGPVRIIDIGCGPGNSTRELKKKWPKAEIIGIDNSPNMIKMAKENLPELEWIVADAGANLSHLGKFDIVFSNAAIQWIPNHEKLIPNLFYMLNENGILAMQIPNVTDMSINKAVNTARKDNKWDIYLNSVTDKMFYDSPQGYYDILCRLSSEIYLWETHYYHVMEGHQSIIDWYRSTGMKPYRDKLPNEELRHEFENDVLRIVEKEYNFQKNGTVLFPFRRMFFVAYN